MANWPWRSPFPSSVSMLICFPPALFKVIQPSTASLLLHLIFGLSLTELDTNVEKCQFWYCWTLLSVISKPAEPTRGQIVPSHMGLFCFRQVSNRFGHVSVTWKEQRAEQLGARWAWPPPPVPALPSPLWASGGRCLSKCLSSASAHTCTCRGCRRSQAGHEAIPGCC